MRTIYILRGAPGSGKSTWIRKNNLEQYTLSADNVRLMYQSPVLTEQGNLAITQENDGRVWRLLLNILEQRMIRGEFVIIDATHYKSNLLAKYKDLISKYRYRAFVVDFTDIPLETVLERNSMRDAYKYVPEGSIRKMYAVFEQNDHEVNSKFKVISREEAKNKLNESLIYDYNQYNKIVVFGDVHGCFYPIQKYFEENPFSDNNAYIFVGDYLDRGIQNREVIEFLLSIKDKKNVLLLEGNHEKWLRMYAENNGAEFDMNEDDKAVLRRYVDKDFFYLYKQNKIRSNTFIEKTIPQIQEISKKDLRQLCRKFGQMAYVSFKDKEYFICHGGISNLPNIFISTEQLISGTGKHEELDTTYESWLRNTNKNCVMIHGHRNAFHIDTKVNDRIYNLDGKPEFGEELRIIEISQDGIEEKSIKNEVFDPNANKKNVIVTNLITKTDNELLKQLNESKLINKKVLDGGLISYNFSRNAFYDKKWNELTCTARGLFVDNETEKVACRSYNKFFNWGEVESTKSENLCNNLVFPVYAYRKENGFLAMVSYNKNKDEILVCSKSTNGGDFVNIIRDHLSDLGVEINSKLKKYVKENNVTMVFECVDPIKDPHIIKYDKNHLFLLDIIKNDFKTERTPFQDICAIADDIGLEHKILENTFFTWEELYKFYKDMSTNYHINYEGWVFEDSSGFMVKFKTPFYRFWKQMRTIKEAIEYDHNLKKNFISEQEIRVTNLMKQLRAEDKLSEMSIIDVEEEYYQVK